MQPVSVKTATGNRTLPGQPDGRLRWRHRDSATRAWRHVDLEPFELLRRFLQHVLPKGFQRVRHYGWLGAAATKKRERIHALLDWKPPPVVKPAPPPPPTCPGCGQPMRCVARLPRAPP